jgi:hypothetical protein
MDTAIGLFKRRHRLTYPQLAELFGISHDYARKLGPGIVNRVSPRLAKRIELVSRGEIKAVDLVFPGEVPRRKRRRRAAGAA